MEYNTQRPILKINDYGRVVAKMIDFAKQLPTREERNQMAHTIIGVMAHLNPKLKERTDYQHILWDHLMIMSDYALDCDCPYNISREETANFHPGRIPLPGSRIRYRHYGRTLEAMVRTIAEMPDSPRRNQLTEQIAHTMKRQYLLWNSDSIDDNVIRQQMHELSDGRLTLPEDFQFHNTQELLHSAADTPAGTTKKKKKKKKKSKTNGQL